MTVTWPLSPSVSKPNQITTGHMAQPIVTQPYPQQPAAQPVYGGPQPVNGGPQQPVMAQPYTPGQPVMAQPYTPK